MKINDFNNKLNKNIWEEAPELTPATPAPVKPDKSINTKEIEKTLFDIANNFFNIIKSNTAQDVKIQELKIKFETALKQYKSLNADTSINNKQQEFDFKTSEKEITKTPTNYKQKELNFESMNKIVKEIIEQQESTNLIDYFDQLYSIMQNLKPGDQQTIEQFKNIYAKALDIYKNKSNSIITKLDALSQQAWSNEHAKILLNLQTQPEYQEEFKKEGGTAADIMQLQNSYKRPEGYEFGDEKNPNRSDLIASHEESISRALKSLNISSEDTEPVESSVPDPENEKDVKDAVDKDKSDDEFTDEEKMELKQKINLPYKQQAKILYDKVINGDIDLLKTLVKKTAYNLNQSGGASPSIVRALKGPEGGTLFKAILHTAAGVDDLKESNIELMIFEDQIIKEALIVAKDMML